jgi:hypothetical protein
LNSALRLLSVWANTAEIASNAIIKIIRVFMRIGFCMKQSSGEVKKRNVG